MGSVLFWKVMGWEGGVNRGKGIGCRGEEEFVGDFVGGWIC